MSFLITSERETEVRGNKCFFLLANARGAEACEGEGGITFALSTSFFLHRK